MPLPAVTSDPAVKSSGRPEVRSRPPPRSTPYPHQPVHLHCGPRCFYTGRCPGAPWESSSQPLRDKTACPSHTHTAVNHAAAIHVCLHRQSVLRGASLSRAAAASHALIAVVHRCQQAQHKNTVTGMKAGQRSAAREVEGSRVWLRDTSAGWMVSEQCTVKRSEGRDF